MKTNVLLMGPIGTGKTRSLRTIPPTGKTLLTLSLEPGIESIFGPLSKEGDFHGPRAHWASVLPATTPFEVLRQNALLTNTLDQKGLANTRRSNPHEYRQFIEIYDRCTNFTCDRCGEAFGPIDKLSDEFVFAIDGLSGISRMAMDLQAGGKPTTDKPDFYIAQQNIRNFLTKCLGISASFILTSHISREVDQIRGGFILTVLTLGQALAPEIPLWFDEVIQTRRSGGEFFWSSVENNSDLKARRLPFSDTIKPDFAQLLLETTK